MDRACRHESMARDRRCGAANGHVTVLKVSPGHCHFGRCVGQFAGSEGDVINYAEDLLAKLFRQRCVSIEWPAGDDQDMESGLTCHRRDSRTRLSHLMRRFDWAEEKGGGVAEVPGHCQKERAEEERPALTHTRLTAAGIRVRDSPGRVTR